MMTVIFHSDFQGTAKGALLTFNAVKSICGRTSLTEQFSSFYSPNWEIQGKYPNNVKCTWTITVQEGHAISLKFAPDHQTEKGADLVKVYNSPNSLVPLATYSGQFKWNSVISDTNYLRVGFTSDAQNTFSGFSASYQVIKPGKNCSCGQTNLQIVDPQGSSTLISPNFPSTNYCSNQKCIWTLTVPNLFNVKIDFNHFEMENGPDYLVFFNGPSTKAPIIQTCTGIYCKSVISKSNGLTLMMVTDNGAEKSGFSAIWRPVIA